MKQRAASPNRRGAASVARPASVSREYTEDHARSGTGLPLPEIECWENQYAPRPARGRRGTPDASAGYEIEIRTPEFTSVCPRTGLPDHGTLTLTYVPDRKCLELKSLKMYWLAYRNIGIFQENVVNRFLRDVVAACQPVRATVVGEFTPRGGVYSKITASWSRERGYGG